MLSDRADAGQISHGYTTADVHRLVHYAVTRAPWQPTTNSDELQAAAWHAACEFLLLSPTAPTPADIIRAARRAAAAELRRTRVHTDRPRTVAYWRDAARPVDSHEDRVVEWLTLMEIWPRLAAQYREVLIALADYGDYEAAARSLGMTYNVYSARLRRARIAVLDLWWAGEPPRRTWRDRRRTGDATAPAHSLSAHLRRRRRQGAA
jgi:hypothetical protein